jgi:exodeoxyribonuclease VII large subunit
LQAFNSEPVARAIFASDIPIVSAIGHETDYTIADFVADLRAPTPSAAAELVVPEKSDLQRHCQVVAMGLQKKITSYFKELNTKINNIAKRLIDPRRRVGDHRLRLDDHSLRLSRILRLRIRREREYLAFWQDRLSANPPGLFTAKANKKLELINEKLLKSFIIYYNSKRMRVRELMAKLEALDPLAILARGYSVTRTIPAATVVTNSKAVALSQELEIMLAKGRLICRVTGKKRRWQRKHLNRQ